MVPEVHGMEKGFHASRAHRCSLSLGVPYALSFPWRTLGKSQINRWKEGRGVSPPLDPARNTTSNPTLTYTPLLRYLQMVITTVYKLIRSLAGKGTGNKRRGVISGDLSSASRAAAGSSAAGAQILGLAPFAHKKDFFRQT